MFPHYRSYYRLRYPETGRPVFLSEEDKRTYPVIDVSEEGFRFLNPSAAPEDLPEVGAHFRGHIRFRSGTVSAVAGEVVRIQNGEVAIRLVARRIAFATMLKEQLFLRRRYPEFFSEFQSGRIGL